VGHDRGRAGGPAEHPEVAQRQPRSAARHLALYRAIMFGDSGLSRAEREAVAVTVSQANDCFY
jgi:alkylhydroperoxidase family enzyme